MSDIPPQYQPQSHEPAIYKKWEDSGAFEPDEEALAAGRQPFVIMLPPPNITGSLHMGHALNTTIQDILVRYHRMKGEPTLWLPGTDHAGIATQNVVERQLREESTSRHQLGRDKFLERVWTWREQYGSTIIKQLKRLGASCDWSRTVFTMDKAYLRAVQHAFIEYYSRGYIYRGNRIVNWCPRCASVISDLEVKHLDQTGTLTTLRYPLKDGSGYIDVATTRPETMLGDTAVAVHPDDERYQNLIGQTVILPLMKRPIPIIADEHVDRAFGTGAVKVTPAHDPLDAEIGTTHKLAAINVIGEDGAMTQAAGQFAGLPANKARQAVLEQLRKENAVVAEREHQHAVATCDRCHTAIQPLVSRQWFVNMSQLKKKAIKVVQEDQGKNSVKFYPPRWQKHFLAWMENVHDWTISRQLWWGQPIPVWWKLGARGTNQEENNYVVAIEKPAGEWEADPDVLDTWFSSALWPFATLGWPDQTEDLKCFYPTTTLSTARDIIYLWVARMVFSSLELVGKIPFCDVLIHPTVLNIKGQRMSKSLGTGVDPLELIDKYGADATRFSLVYQMSFDNQAIKFDESATKAARNFSNKIWNLARLLQSLPEQGNATIADRWIEQRSQRVATAVTALLNQYKLGEAARALYEFVWNDFADWYVEILKVKGSTKVAKQVFVSTLQLLHPFLPHLTELLWEHFGESGQLITSTWPMTDTGKTPGVDRETPGVEEAPAMSHFQDIVITVRSARALLSLPPGSIIKLYIKNPPALNEALEKLCRAELVDAPAKTMKQFPLSGDGAVFIGAKEINKSTIKQARQRLANAAKQLNQFIKQQTKALSTMRGKAPDGIISAKEAAIVQAQLKIKEIAKSQKLL